MTKFRKLKDSVLEDLKDKDYAKTYLAIALEDYERDRDLVCFLTSLKDVVEAQGGMTRLSEKTNLNRQNLYKVLSKRGKPRFDTVETILHG